MPILIPIPIPIICRKTALELIPVVIWMQSYYDNYLKNHIISLKLGTAQCKQTIRVHLL